MSLRGLRLHPQPGRRRLALRIAILLGALALWVGTALVMGYVRDRGWVGVGSLGAIDRAGVVYVPHLRLFVVANGSRPTALSAVSPHLGERLLFCRSSGYFQDQDGDRFDRLGRYAGVPGPRGMAPGAGRLQGDASQINT